MVRQSITLAIFFAVALFPVPAKATTYQYDNLHRLRKVTYNNGIQINYTYDAVGNRLTRQVLGLIRGDVDGDGHVTTADLSLVLANLDKSSSDGSFDDSRADVDKDGEVTSSDLAIVLMNME